MSFRWYRRRSERPSVMPECPHAASGDPDHQEPYRRQGKPFGKFSLIKKDKIFGFGMVFHSYFFRYPVFPPRRCSMAITHSHSLHTNVERHHQRRRDVPSDARVSPQHRGTIRNHPGAIGGSQKKKSPLRNSVVF